MKYSKVFVYKRLFYQVFFFFHKVHFSILCLNLLTLTVHEKYSELSKKFTLPNAKKYMEQSNVNELTNSSMKTFDLLSSV